jgi:hypothetical protein
MRSENRHNRGPPIDYPRKGPIDWRGPLGPCDSSVVCSQPRARSLEISHHDCHPRRRVAGAGCGMPTDVSPKDKAS